MAQSKSRKRTVPGSSSQSTPPRAAQGEFNPPHASTWSRTTRQIVSAILLLYMGIVLIGPLSNPVASTHLSAPLARIVAPVHRVLFLGHGYRFFGPDPGASHRLIYRGVKHDGSEFSGAFPDRDSHWPRLLYHRWFMLSETIYNEQMIRPSEQQFTQRANEYERQIKLLRTEGKLELLEQLKRERDLEAEFYRNVTDRVEFLFEAVAQELSRRHDGSSIELFVQERKIPFPEEVADGLRLDDEGLLTEPIKIGEMDAQGFRLPVLEVLPEQEEAQ